ncbi:unnamed protein product [Symbiodinium sp. CCMP2592]|nr:unnamed protein product [Symbiodinium sp. CCMP2592]
MATSISTESHAAVLELSKVIPEVRSLLDPLLQFLPFTLSDGALSMRQANRLTDEMRMEYSPLVLFAGFLGLLHGFMDVKEVLVVEGADGFGIAFNSVRECELCGVINDVGEEEATVNKLETEEEEGAGYQDAHPCDVAGDAGGTSGKIGGGDGSDTRDQMPYDQLDGCHARDIERALVDGKETFWHDSFETSVDLADNIAGLICTVIPIAAIEPFGAWSSEHSARA